MQLTKEDGELVVRALRHYAAWLRETFVEVRFQRRRSNPAAHPEDRLKRLEDRTRRLAEQITVAARTSPP